MNQCEEKLHSALSAYFYMQPFLTFIFFQSLHTQSLWSQSQKKYTWIMKPTFNPKLNYCYFSCNKIPQYLWITKLTKGFVLQTLKLEHGQYAKKRNELAMYIKMSIQLCWSISNFHRKVLFNIQNNVTWIKV